MFVNRIIDGCLIMSGGFVGWPIVFGSVDLSGFQCGIDFVKSHGNRNSSEGGDQIFHERRFGYPDPHSLKVFERSYGFIGGIKAP